MLEFNKFKIEFSKEYYSKIYSKLCYWETKRKSYLKKAFEQQIKFTIIGLILLYVAFLLKSTDIGMILGIIAIFALGASYPAYDANFKMELKKNFYPEILQILGNIKHSLGQGIEKKEIAESLLFEKSDNTLYVDDCIYGEYKGVEIFIEEAIASSKYQCLDSAFKGVIFRVKSNKKISAKTIIKSRQDVKIDKMLLFLVPVAIFSIIVSVGIIPRVAASYLCIFPILAMLISILIIVNFSLKLELFLKNKRSGESELFDEVHLEDPVFASKFQVLSKNQIESRYLVTVSFMERLLDLKTLFNASSLQCSFYGDQILFAISTKKNLFELTNLYTQINTSAAINLFLAQILSILYIVDYFKLDQKTGL